jgi:hypothetical protein
MPADDLLWHVRLEHASITYSAVAGTPRSTVALHQLTGEPRKPPA